MQIRQNFIRGRYLNYEGQTIAGFYVHGISSEVTPSRDGSPRYSVRCQRCLHYDIRTQTELSRAANGAFTPCSNATCSASTVQHAESESIADLRRAERQEQVRKTLEAETERQKAAQRAAKEAAERRHLESFRDDHRRFVLQQINQGVPAEQIMSLEKFANLRYDVRERINQAVTRQVEREQ
jgi:hypothetical protein